MLIRSVLFNFQGAFLNLVAFVCLSSLGDLIIISLSELFVKWFFKIFLKKFWKHLPKVITLAGWRRHPDLNWGSGCCRPMPYHLAIAPKLERITRLELATSTLARWRSTRWAKSAFCVPQEHFCSACQSVHTKSNALSHFGNNASPEAWRSGWDSNPRPLPWQGSVLTNWTTRPHGGNYRARTYDPLLVRQMLSQLS